MSSTLDRLSRRPVSLDSGTSRGGARSLAALFAGATALRPQIIGIGPLIPAIQADLHMSHAVTGLLGTIPVLFLGLAAPFGATLSRRFGSRRAVGWSLGAMALFGAARAIAPSAVPMILLTVGLALGMGVSNAIMPIAVKEQAPGRPAFATGVYASGISLGSAVTAAVAVPIAHVAGGWRASLLVFAGITAICACAWLVGVHGSSGDRAVRITRPQLPFRSRMVWLLVALLALLATVYYGLGAWLSDSYVERGWTEADAGWLVGAFNLAVFPSGILIGLIADRAGSRRLWFASSAVVLVIGAAFVVAGDAFAWPAVVFLGIGNGALFAVLMTIPLDVGKTPAEVGAVVGLMLGGGYGLASAVPFALGAIRDLTGSFTSAFWVLVAASCLMVLLAAPLSRHRLQRALPRPAAEPDADLRQRG